MAGIEGNVHAADQGAVCLPGRNIGCNKIEPSLKGQVPAGDGDVPAAGSQVLGEIEGGGIGHRVDEIVRLGERAGGVDLIQHGHRVAEIPMIRRQIDGRIRTGDVSVDAHAGADHRKEDEPVHPSKTPTAVSIQLLLEPVRVSPSLTNEGGSAMNIKGFHDLPSSLERMSVVQLPPKPK